MAGAATSGLHRLAPVLVHAADQRLGDHVVGIGDVLAAELGQGAVEGLLRRSPSATARSPRRRRPRRSRPGRTGWPGAAAAAPSPRCRRRSAKWVQTKSKAPWPSGRMCRVDTEFTCCWKITLGNTVVITAVGPPHQGSGTMSRKRGSSSFMSALKLDDLRHLLGLAHLAAGRDHRGVAMLRVHHAAATCCRRARGRRSRTRCAAGPGGTGP